MQDSDKYILVAIAIVVVGILIYAYRRYSNDKKEGYTPDIANDGTTANTSSDMQMFMTPPSVIDNSNKDVEQANVDMDTQFANNFFFGGDHDRYDQLFNNPENVLNEKTRPVEIAPNVDLPLGAGPEAYNAQRHEYRRLRRSLGYHRALQDLPAFELFGSRPAETVFTNSMTGRPLQLMTNNSRDMETGVIARLERVTSRRDMDQGFLTNPVTVPLTVPASGVLDAPNGAVQASFSPYSGTLKISDEREVPIPATYESTVGGADDGMIGL